MNEFLNELDAFIYKTIRMPRFKGQTQAVTALRRIRDLAVFNRKVGE